jgi:hypothetical protein
MAVRFKNLKVKCATCPKPPDRASRSATKIVTEPPSEKLTLSEQQGMKLWSHVLFGTGTCVGMIEGYARQDMPGDPREAITELRDRLSEVLISLQRREEITNH